MTRLTKKILNKLFYFYRLINHTISKRFLKKKYIAHHGLQRNGTNFLLHALRHLDVDVINEFDKKGISLSISILDGTHLKKIYRNKFMLNILIH